MIANCETKLWALSYAQVTEKSVQVVCKEKEFEKLS